MAKHAAVALLLISLVLLAGALTPVRYGSTNGLRNMPCSIAPQSASEAPTVAATQTRGRRSSQMMTFDVPVACG